MDGILNWVKEFLILYLILTILMHLAAADQYKKYLRFFSGMILLFVLLTPLMRLFGNDGRLEALISGEIFWEELDSIRRDTQKLEFLQNDHYRRKYEQAIEDDIALQASEKDFPILSVSVTLTQKYEISRVTVRLDTSGGQDPAAAKESLLTFLRDIYALEEKADFYQRLKQNGKAGKEFYEMAY